MSKTIAPLGLKTAFLAAGLCVSMTVLAQPAHNPATPLSTQAFRRANGDSLAIDMTSDGRYVLIYSTATNLVPNDTNGVGDLFLVDTTLRSIDLVARRGAIQANGLTYRGVIADDGGIVILTVANNLGDVGDNNRLPDALYRPPLSSPDSPWRYISVDQSGTPIGCVAAYLSKNGEHIVWHRDLSTPEFAFYNTRTNSRSSVSLSQVVGGGRLRSIQLKGISDNGRYILFIADVMDPSSSYWSRRVYWYDRDGDDNGVFDDVITPGRAFTDIQHTNPDRLPMVQALMSNDGQSIGITVQDSVPELTVYHVPSGRSYSISTGSRDPYFYYLKSMELIIYTYTHPNGTQDVRLWDGSTGTSRIVSVDAWGRERSTLNPGPMLISDSGTQIVLSLFDDNWVPGDTNQRMDLFIRVLDEGKTSGLTAGPGTLNNEAAGSVYIDRTGSIAVFASSASNLVPGDTNNVSDIFIRFPDTSLRRIMAHNGAEPNGPSYDPRISSDGNWVVFRSYATNLTPEGGNGNAQIYLYSIPENRIWLISRNSAGQLGNADSHSPSVSQDGMFVAFASLASNLVSGDTNNEPDIFIYSRSDGGIFRIVPNPDDASSNPNGPSGDPVISNDGRWVAFSSSATNYVTGDTNAVDDIFLYDRVTRQFIRITQAGAQLNGDSYQPSISGDGRYVAFASEATNIDSRDTDSLPDIYVWDRQTGALTLASVNSFGRKANLGGRRPSISLDGQRVAFESDATNLMPLDIPSDTDIFVYDVGTGWIYPISIRGCVPGEAPSFTPVISGDGRWVAFQTNATNLSDLPTGADAYTVIQQVICTPPGDVDRSGMVDDADLLVALFEFGQQSSCADVTMDGIVDDADLLIILLSFGLHCPQFLYNDDSQCDSRHLELEALLGEATEVGGFADDDGYHYYSTSMTPALLKSLERQAAEIDMMHQGRWPYPVAGLGSEPWIATYGDPLTMSEEELQALLERFHNPPQQDEGDFSPASGGSCSYSQSKSVRLGGSDVNISVNGSFWLYVSCTQAKAEAKGDANIKFFSLNYKVAEAYGLAESTNTQTKLNAYFKIAGSTLWSYNRTWNNTSYTYASQCYYNGSNPNIGPWNRQWSFRHTWWLGPVPVRVTAGINLTAGACYMFHGQHAPVKKAEARFRPYVQSSAFANGGVAWSIGCPASAGVGINLTLLNDTLEAYAIAQLSIQNNRCCANFTAGIHNTITALQGRFHIYAEACCWGLSGPRCGWGRKRQRWEWDLFRWGGYTASGHLFGPWSYTYCCK